jgi:exodeoxyribonuclease-3
VATATNHLPMKLLSWNIRQGGGSRAARIVAAIAEHDPDVIALSEFRGKPGAHLCAELASRGWQYITSTTPVGNDNGLCVLSRTPMVCGSSCYAPAESSVRWLDIDFPDRGFGLGVLHIVCAGSKLKGRILGEAKKRFWNAVLRAAEVRLHEPLLFLVDFNTGVHRLDEAGRTFKCAEHFAGLSALGWTDTWRDHNKGRTEWTWYSRLKGGALGNGFRLDHAFSTPSLRPRIASCWYSHKGRESGVSDHSLLIVELD